VINPRERFDTYRRMGLCVEQRFDPPGHIIKYGERSYLDRVRLYTISGQAALTLFNIEPPQIIYLVPGTEHVIEAGVRHKIEVNQTGWKYMAAFSSAEQAAYHVQQLEQDAQI
jgi:hypothetical protein